MSNSKLNGLFGNSKKYNKPSGPPEPCELNVGDNQVVKAIIPHGTPRAAAIRELLKTQVLNGEGARIFYWHEEHDAWTNVHFKSTASNPLLGAPPVEAVEKAYDVFNKSSAVSAVKITDEDGEILTLQQVKAMRFTSLEESAIAEPEEEEEVDEVADAVVELQSAVASLVQTHGELQAKVSRLEDEVQDLKEYKALAKLAAGEMKSELQRMQVSAPQNPPENHLQFSEDEGDDEVTPPPSPKKLSRLQRAADKKRRLESGPSGLAPEQAASSEPAAASDDDEDQPVTRRATRGKKRRL